MSNPLSSTSQWSHFSCVCLVCENMDHPLWQSTVTTGRAATLESTLCRFCYIWICQIRWWPWIAWTPLCMEKLAVSIQDMVMLITWTIWWIESSHYSNYILVELLLSGIHIVSIEDKNHLKKWFPPSFPANCTLSIRVIDLRVFWCHSPLKPILSCTCAHCLCC